METLRKVFSTLSAYVFLASFAIIFICVLFADGGVYSFNKNNPIQSFIIGVIFATILYLIYRKILKTKKQLTKKTEIAIVATAMGAFTILGALIIIFLRVDTTWDVGAIYEAASNLATNGDFGNQYNYISYFPFQTFLIGIFSIIIKCSSWFINPKVVLLLANLGAILGAILFCYFSVRKLFGPKKAIFSLIFFLLFLPILLYTPIFYSDTLSMFFVSGSFLISLHLFEEKINLKKRIILSLLLGLFCFFGFEIKATSIIIIIAIAIFTLLIKKKTSMRLFTISFVCTMAVFTPLWLIMSGLSHRVTDTSQAIPKTHWIMMGLKGYGGFNGEDYTDITWPGLKKRDSLPEKHMAEIKKRLKEYGPSGYILFLSRKIAYTWGDGTYYVGNKLCRSPSHPNSLIYNIVACDGKYFAAYNMFANGLQIMLLSGILICAFLTRKDRSAINILKLALIGLFIFFLIWETRSRYLINYLPLMFILFMYGLDSLTKKINSK